MIYIKYQVKEGVGRIGLKDKTYQKIKDKGGLPPFNILHNYTIAGHSCC